MIKVITNKDSQFLEDGKEKLMELLNEDCMAFMLVTLDKYNRPSFHLAQTGNRKLALFGAIQVVLSKLIHSEYCEDN